MMRMIRLLEDGVPNDDQQVVEILSTRPPQMNEITQTSKFQPAMPSFNPLDDPGMHGCANPHRPAPHRPPLEVPMTTNPEEDPKEVPVIAPFK